MAKYHSSTKDGDGKTSILALDDEYDIVSLIDQSLQKVGQKVCSFTDASLALNHFNSDPKNDYHSMIISDIRMPGMNGYEFIRQLKDIDPKVKVILMSAFEIRGKEFHNLLPDIKVDAFLQKPFSLQQLHDMVLKIKADGGVYVCNGYYTVCA